MEEILLISLITTGALAILFAAIGVLRMPDFFLRLSVTVKAATLGVGLILLAAALVFPEVLVTTKVIAIVFFLLLTSPVSAQMIGRVSYLSGISIWKGTQIDEMEEIHKFEKEPGKEAVED